MAFLKRSGGAAGRLRTAELSSRPNYDSARRQAYASRWRRPMWRRPTSPVSERRPAPAEPRRASPSRSRAIGSAPRRQAEAFARQSDAADSGSPVRRLWPAHSFGQPRWTALTGSPSPGDRKRHQTGGTAHRPWGIPGRDASRPAFLMRPSNPGLLLTSANDHVRLLVSPSHNRVYARAAASMVKAELAVFSEQALGGRGRTSVRNETSPSVQPVVALRCSSSRATCCRSRSRPSTCSAAICGPIQYSGRTRSTSPSSVNVTANGDSPGPGHRPPARIRPPYKPSAANQAMMYGLDMPGWTSTAGLRLLRGLHQDC